MKRVSPESSIRWLFLMGVITIFSVFAGFGIWATNSKISGAIIAPGRLEPSIPSHIISHHKGGITEKVHVRDGMSVEPGDIIVSLDSTELSLGIASVSHALADLIARRMRAEAERFNLTNISESNIIKSQEMYSSLEFDGRIDAQNAVLFEKRERLDRESAYKSVQVLQIDEQLSGLNDEIKATESEMEFVRNELVLYQGLFAKKLVGRSEVTDLKLEKIKISRELGRLVSKRGELKVKRSELSLKSLTLKDEYMGSAQNELDKIGPQISIKSSQLAKLMQEKKSLEIRSPISGHIHDLRVSGKGFVVRSGTPVVKIVSDEGSLQAVVKIGTKDIDQVYVGQSSNIRFLAFNVRSLPLILGEVRSIAADVIKDPLTKSQYFEASIDIPMSELAKLGDNSVGNGMEITAFLKTEEVTPFQYLTRPIAEYLHRALRDR